MLVTEGVPADAEIPSHQLLVRGGYIRRIGSGIYAYLPMMWRVLRKINAIVRDELNSLGALETLLPQLQPADLWEKSGRWQGYTEGEGIMFHLEDRQGRQIGLGPTHEEVITELAGTCCAPTTAPVTFIRFRPNSEMKSARFGLMRGRNSSKDAIRSTPTRTTLKAIRQWLLPMREFFRDVGSRPWLWTPTAAPLEAQPLRNTW